jgi:DNA replication ATP-dependent helicase Dna2
VLTNTRSSNGETSFLAISEVLDVEEDVWSPSYGLKGKIDVSVRAIIENEEFSFFAKGQVKTSKLSSGPMPFEIKTGRSVAGLEHRAQTMLYTLLIGERYGMQVEAGLLYYTQSDEVVRVPATRNEIRSLMVARNKMASYMMRRTESLGNCSSSEQTEDIEDVVKPFLPPTIDDEWICGKCYALDTCMLYRKVSSQSLPFYKAIIVLFSGCRTC